MTPPRFRAADLVAASGLPAAGMELLVKTKLAPPSANKGRGSAHIFTTDGVVHMAIVGAIYAAGVEIVPAARLGSAIIEEFRAPYGYIPEGLDNLSRHLSAEGAALFSDLPLASNGDGPDRFALYGLIQSHCADFEPYAALEGDRFIEIINREFVFSGFYHDLPLGSPFSGRVSDVEAACRLTGWERGSQHVQVIPLSAELPPIGRPMTEASMAARKHAGTALEDFYFDARRKAVSAIRVNIGLAIRNGFAEVIKRRNEQGAS